MTARTFTAAAVLTGALAVPGAAAAMPADPVGPAAAPAPPTRPAHADRVVRVREGDGTLLVFAVGGFTLLAGAAAGVGGDRVVLRRRAI
jgi:hypothetical protein